MQIIHEDPELLVLNKPAGLVCHPTKTGEHSSLIGRLRLYLESGNMPNTEGISAESRVGDHVSSGIAGHQALVAPKPREGASRPSAHLVNRLDRESSGIVIAALTRQAAGELGRLWETRAVQKEYLAIVHGLVPESHGIIDAPLRKDDRSRVAIKDCVRPDGAPARTEYWVEKRFSAIPPASPERPCEGGTTSGIGAAFTLLRVVPHTGRKHQIRIHLAHVGHPIVGDKLYGGDEDLYLALVENRLNDEQRRRLILPHHALHAAQVRFTWRDRDYDFRAESEGWFNAFVKRAKA